MRRLGFYITLSADGMYADPTAWLGPFGPAEDEQLLRERPASADAGDAVMGRVMHDVMDARGRARHRRPGHAGWSSASSAIVSSRETAQARRLARAC